MKLWVKFKIFLDLILILLIIPVVAIPLLFILLLVRLTSPGAVIFRQKRVGKNGKTFTLYKIRTMYVDAEVTSGPIWAEQDDSRITKVGYWLRKLRLDELPQMINVIKGEMSFVGPRPERPFFVNKFKTIIPLYTRRLRVKPGITGWAQIKGKYDFCFEDVNEKIKYDLHYMKNMSFTMDINIIFNTIIIIIKGNGQ